MEKAIKYTYATDEKRIKKIKMEAIKEGVPTNKLLDKIIDSYLGKKE